MYSHPSYLEHKGEVLTRYIGSGAPLGKFTYSTYQDRNDKYPDLES